MANLPQFLSGHQAPGLTANHPVAQFEIGDEENFVYLILDWTSRKAAIVDPQRDLSPPLDALGAHGFELSAILLTHTHPDHVAGVPGLVRRFPGIPLHLHEDDLHRLAGDVTKAASLRILRDGETIKVGTIPVQALHTPGHSPGECCYLVPGTPPFLFTGDTVFIRDCGRTDLAGGSTARMFESLQRIKKLAPETIILPGHHYQKECASTLEGELRESAPMRCRSVSELEALP